MSCLICSQCGGSGKISAKGTAKSAEKKTCRCCKGSGYSPDQKREMELAVFLKNSVRSRLSGQLLAVGEKTGSIAVYKQ